MDTFFKHHINDYFKKKEIKSARTKYRVKEWYNTLVTVISKCYPHYETRCSIKDNYLHIDVVHPDFTNPLRFSTILEDFGEVNNACI
jgi:hypothetical protein